MLWEHARGSGIFMWLSDANAVVSSRSQRQTPQSKKQLTCVQRRHFEVIARNEYAKSDVKNPVDCSLFYLALRKKTVLQGLWRMASWNKEQGGHTAAAGQQL